MTLIQAKKLLNNPNFVRWFGKSVVKDETGNPLRVFHGTPQKNIKQFDINMVGNNTDEGVLGKGFYFDSDKQIADFYQRGDGTTIESFLNIRNPLIVKDIDNYKNNAGLWKTEALIDSIRKKYPNDKLKNYTYNEALEWLEKEPGSINSEITDFLKKKGHDGVSFNGEYVVFDPTQIKSVNNRGTFDPTNPNILKGTAIAAGVGSTLAVNNAYAKDWSNFKSDEQGLEDAYNPLDMAVAAATGGGTLTFRAAQAALDPIIDTVSRKIFGE